MSVSGSFVFCGELPLAVSSEEQALDDGLRLEFGHKLRRHSPAQR